MDEEEELEIEVKELQEGEKELVVQEEEEEVVVAAMAVEEDTRVEGMRQYLINRRLEITRQQQAYNRARGIAHWSDYLDPLMERTRRQLDTK